MGYSASTMLNAVIFIVGLLLLALALMGGLLSFLLRLVRRAIRSIPR